VTELPNYVPFKPMPRTPLSRIFTAMSRDAVALMEGLLSCDPSKRLTATEALKHPCVQPLLAALVECGHGSEHTVCHTRFVALRGVSE
jgi:serine/threonine protein kinase